MEKTRNLFKKIGEIKGKFHARIGTIKDKNGMDLTEAEGIKKRWQEYTEKLYKISVNDLDNHVCKTAKETLMYRTVFWTLWERERVG